MTEKLLGEIKNTLEMVRADLGEIKLNTEQLKTVVLGVAGTPSGGLVGQMETHNHQLQNLRAQVEKLTLRFWVFAALIGGTGGGSVYGILKLLS